MKEEWKDIKGYEGVYQVSNFGRVRSLDRYCISNTNNQFATYTSKRLLKGKILKAYDNGNGYLMISLLKNMKRKVYYVHRLVGEYFLSQKEEEEINHIDGNKYNNDVRNLEWCSRSENLLHAYKTGLKPNTTLKQQNAARNNLKKMTLEQRISAQKKAVESIKNKRKNL